MALPSARGSLGISGLNDLLYILRCFTIPQRVGRRNLACAPEAPSKRRADQDLLNLLPSAPLHAALNGRRARNASAASCSETPPPWQAWTRMIRTQKRDSRRAHNTHRGPGSSSALKHTTLT
jgi:hypothetical protein